MIVDVYVALFRHWLLKFGTMTSQFIFHEIKSCWIQSILKPDRPIPCGSRSIFKSSMTRKFLNSSSMTSRMGQAIQVLKTSTPIQPVLQQLELFISCGVLS